MGNLKLETRNPKSETDSKNGNAKIQNHHGSTVQNFSEFDFQVCFVLLRGRISDFGFSGPDAPTRNASRLG
jgi:hypothetical protein